MAEELLSGAAAQSAVGAIVPHAGWIYSGATAARGVVGVAGCGPEVVVIFGSVHVPVANRASLYPGGAWETPLGLVEVDGELAGRLAGCRDVEVDAGAHRMEHSIEVQLPLLQMVLPGVKVVPMMVLPGMWAEGIGRECARVAVEERGAVGFLGSTDLTHYGPAFGFEPAGRGAKGVAWARDVNDRRLVELIRGMDAAGVIREAEVHRSACGAGAVAAMIGAMGELGATQYVELEHRTSAECKVMGTEDGQNSVGYEAGVFLRPGEAI
jgi:hypothetical protein